VGVGLTIVNKIARKDTMKSPNELGDITLVQKQIDPLKEGELLLIKQCLKNNRDAQKALYDKYAPKLYGVALRYSKRNADADDILQESFIKIFKYLGDFRGEGSFEGWMRRTVVTTALNFHKKRNLIKNYVELEDVKKNNSTLPEAFSTMTAEEILKLVRELPPGYNTVFNLHNIEGYTHKEIGKILDISHNTSKSQLSRARQSLQKKISKLGINAF